MANSITVDQLIAYLGIDRPAEGDGDLSVLTDAVAAVNVLVPGTVPRVRAMAPGTDWPADVHLAALMQAAKLFQRRRSPSGATYSDMGGPVYTPRWDPDIARLLQIGSWERPGFA